MLIGYTIFPCTVYGFNEAVMVKYTDRDNFNNII
jgi:hypothetical protein